MTYVLEKMTLEDKNKIFTDLELDPKKKRLVIAYKLFEFFDRVNWAVDRKSNSYIILAPISLEHPLDHKFYFFYKKNWYALWVKAMFENEVNFEDSEPNRKECRQEFRNQLKQALLAIGRYSEGSPDLFNSIYAEFKK